MFFPLKDLNPTRRVPVVTIGLIAVNAVVFLYELALGQHLGAFIASFGAIPYEITHGTDLVGRYTGSPIIHFAGPPVIRATLLTSMFMHGGFMHIFGNMLYLWIFGNNVEDILGRTKFLLFYLVCGLLASLAQIMAIPGATVPTVGASGAVAGVLGAYLLAYPNARVVSLVFLGFFIRLVTVPAWTVLGFWFLIQAFQGVASLGTGTMGGVAWFAHIGGFTAGLLGLQLIAARDVAALRAARRSERLATRRQRV